MSEGFRLSAGRSEPPLLIAGGTLVDPVARKQRKADVLVRDGVIAAIDAGISAQLPRRGVATIQRVDATGFLVTPGLVDMHVHLREPGYEYKETIATGARAAVAGGVTSVACMANTKPVNDSPAVTRFILERAHAAQLAKVFPIGALSVGLAGAQLAPFAGMYEAGIIAISDDGHAVSDAELMRRALECAKMFGMPVIDHAEDRALAAGGLMHEGAVSLRLGLRGVPSAAEDVMVARDIALASLTGGHLHVAHISSAGAVGMVRRARAAGVHVTAEVSPHHLWLTDEAVVGYNTNAKMAPPLRSESDRQALREALADGTIDCIATDHAPHHRDEKDVEFEQAANGVVGLETLLPLTLRLVDERVLDLPTAIAKITSEPAAILGLPVGTLDVGRAADLTVIDPTLEWTVAAPELLTKSKNTPFDGWTMRGRAVLTMVDGRVVHDLRGEGEAPRRARAEVRA
ncbi:MAG TPA: dihydroorotase [Candidatus Binatia bacterium]|nr:dihydroorotase [Candidatus Binatia bacterium]